MSMSIAEMRQFIMNEYSGMKWKERVSKMADNQVIAIYHRIISQPKEVREQLKRKEDFHQMDMFEYMAGMYSDNDSIPEAKPVPPYKVQLALDKVTSDYQKLVTSKYAGDNAMVFSLRYVRELLNGLLEDDETDAK